LADLFFLTKVLFEYILQFRALREAPEEMKQWAEWRRPAQRCKAT